MYLSFIYINYIKEKRKEKDFILKYMIYKTTRV